MSAITSTRPTPAILGHQAQVRKAKAVTAAHRDLARAIRANQAGKPGAARAAHAARARVVKLGG